MNRPAALPHQIEAHTKFLNLKQAALLADMGTGKTRIAVDWFQAKDVDRVVVIAPSIVAKQWVNEQLKEHCCNVHYKALAYKSKHTNKYTRKLDNFIMSAKYAKGLHILCLHFETFVNKVGTDLVSQFLSTSKKDPVIIVDESSRIKNPDAKSVRNILKLRSQYPNSYRMIMSGTPASKSPVDLWSQFEFLTPNFFNCGYVAFNAIHTVRTQKYVKVKGRLITIETTLDKDTYDKIKLIIARNTKDGVLHPDVPNMVQQKFKIDSNDFQFVMNSQHFQRFKHMDAIQNKIAPITYAIKREDCVDLPPKIYKRIPCQLNPEQKRLIKELVKYSATVYRGDTLTVEVKALIGLRVLQICGGNFSHLTDLEGKFESKPIKGVNHKLNYLIGDIPEIGEQQFTVCAVYTPEIIEIYKQAQKIADVGCLYGATSENERDRVIADFKEGRIQGLIMNPQVGGFGLNLQNATVQYWFSRNYRTEVRLQTEDRQHRIGTVKSPIYKDLVSEIQWEEDVLDVLQEGREINDVFLNKNINDIFKL
jgi:SNF2 family DNA or RNA helicase